MSFTLLRALSLLVADSFEHGGFADLALAHYAYDGAVGEGLGDVRIDIAFSLVRHS